MTVPTRARVATPAEWPTDLSVGLLLPFLTIRIVFFSDMSDRYVELLIRCCYRRLSGEGVTIGSSRCRSQFSIRLPDDETELAILPVWW